MEAPLARVRRSIANQYVFATSEAYAGELEAINTTSFEAWSRQRLTDIRHTDWTDETKAWAIKDVHNREADLHEVIESAEIGQRVFGPVRDAIASMAGLSEHEKQRLYASVEAVVLNAKQEMAAKRADPFFYEPSQQDLKLREAAAATLPASTSIETALRYKEETVSKATLRNIVGSVKRWKEIIGSSDLGSITTYNLNRFARELKREDRTTEVANKYATRMLSLIKAYNENQEVRLNIPEWDPVKMTMEERIKLKTKERAIDPGDACKVLDYAKSKDPQVWRAILILNNSTFRISEVMGLKWGHIKEKDEIYYFDINDSKTVTGVRRLPLNKALQRDLLPLRGDDDDFIVDKWQHWERPASGLQAWLEKTKKKLEINGNANAHAWRHLSGGYLGYSQTEHLKKTLMGHCGGLTDRYTREDMKSLSQAVECLGSD